MATRKFTPDPHDPPKLPPELAEAQERMTAEEIEAGARSDPDNPPMTDAELDAAAISRRVRLARERTGLTQAAFARRYHIPLQSLRNWEAGRRRPDAAAAAYLSVIGAMPDAVARVLDPA